MMGEKWKNMEENLIKQALARAYTHEENSKKELDSELLNSMVIELTPLLNKLEIEVQETIENIQQETINIALKQVSKKG